MSKKAKKKIHVYETISLGSCVTLNPEPIPTPSEDMETTMNTVAVNSNDTNARRAIHNAIYGVVSKVTDEARKTFGFVESRRPKTAQELVEWIKAGDIVMPDVDDPDYDPVDYRYESFLGITFPPKIKKDWEGYDKHMENFRKDEKALELEVQVLEPAEALKSFKKFESKWIH